LEDIKSLNLALVTKLQEAEKSLTKKTSTIQGLEVKALAMADTLQSLDVKFVEVQLEKERLGRKWGSLEEEVEIAKARVVEVEGDFRIEKEWRVRMQEVQAYDKETISSLRQEVEFLSQVSTEYESVRQENLRLREQVKESEQTMEELGQQLSWSKLQADTMKEEVLVPGMATWEKDDKATSCKQCSKEFSIARRKHHCRNCGGIFCDMCSDNKMPLVSSAKSLRVCDTCYTNIITRQAKA